MTVPKLSKKRRKAASEKAAYNRHMRAKLLNAVREGEIDPKKVILCQNGNQIVMNTRVKSFIEHWPGVSKLEAEQIMEKAGISQSRRIGGLGYNQADALLDIWADIQTDEKTIDYIHDYFRRHKSLDQRTQGD